VANADGGAFRILKKAGPNDQSFFSACWMPDGKSLFCQDLTNLYRIDLDGIVIKQWPLQQLFPKGDMDSNVCISASPDGGALLMDVNMDMDSGRDGWDGPPPSIWEMDLSTEKAEPVTPIFWWEPCWVNGDQFLCIEQGPKEKEPLIYLRSLDGKTRKVIVKDATDPSVSE
jgi:TolB protein